MSTGGRAPARKGGSLAWTLVGAVAALLLAAMWVAPLLWALSTALRPEHETVSNVFHWLPRDWTLEAFAKVLAAGNVARWLFAAVMDGAGPLRILWSVYLPLSGNIVWAMAIVTFIGAWNNFLWPFIIVTSNDMMTIPLGLTQTYDAFGVRYAQLMAAALVGALPVALAYALFQRRVTHGFLAATGLKG